MYKHTLIDFIFKKSFFTTSAMIVSRRTNKWNRSREFYPTYYAIHDAVSKKLVTLEIDYLRCPGCTVPYSEKNLRVDYKIKKYNGEKIHSFICLNCNKDVEKKERKREGEDVALNRNVT